MHKRKTLAVPMSAHRINRDKVTKLMQERGQAGILFVNGGTTVNQYDTDTEHLFRLVLIWFPFVCDFF